MAETPRTMRDATGANSPRVGVGVLLEHRRRQAGLSRTVGARCIREALEEVGLEIAIDRLLCVTDHLLPSEAQHWVSPAYLARTLRGEAANREPDKTREVRWFPLDSLPPNLTITARNAIQAYRRT